MDARSACEICTDFVFSLPQFDKLYEEGRLEAEFDSFEVVRAWTGVILDQAGYEEVAAKKEWVKAIEVNLHIEAMSPVPEVHPNTIRTLNSRKFDWGDWQKQEMAARDLVQASCYE